jgi:L,D-transpeptidase catalytic domain/Scaffold domain
MFLSTILLSLCALSAQSAPSISEALRTRLEQLHDARATPVFGLPLRRPDAVVHFFEGRGFEPAWTIPAGSDQLRQAIREIENDGLTPAAYHLAAIGKLIEARRVAPSRAVDVDLQILLTDATIAAMKVSAETRVLQVRVNLERARWVIGGLSDSFVLVNLPAFKVYVIRNRTNVWESRTQIGKEARQTPAFRADMRYLVFNPDWTVPPTILAKDVLAGMRKGENPIARKRLMILDRNGRAVDPATIDWATATPRTFPYTLRQPPGADNALGRVKFIFPNEHSIFLHDTPSRELFSADQRTFSSGCIRVERALELAGVLLEGQEGWTAERIQETVGSGQSRTVPLAAPLPVLIVYWTVSVGAGGDLRYARDVYNLDPAVIKKLE